MSNNEIPYGYCHCGCGNKTNLAMQDNLKYGGIKGEPWKYLRNHSKRRPLADRFWEKVDKSEDCWEWIGGHNKEGYGRMGGTVKNKFIYAHRVSWELAYGPVPEGLYVLHKCDNPPCCRPTHLFLGTKKDNSDDMVKKGRGVSNPLLGEKHRFAVLNDQQVLEIRDLAGTLTQLAIAARYNITQSNVSSIINRGTWTHI